MVTTINLVDTDEESPPPQSKLTLNPSLNNNSSKRSTANTTTGTNAIAGPSNAGINRITKNGRNSNASFATSGTTTKGKGKGKGTGEVIMLSSDDDDDDGGAGDRTVTARRPPISRIGRNGIEEITLDSGSESESPRSPPQPRSPPPPPTSQGLLALARASKSRASDIARQGMIQSPTTPRASTSQTQPRRQLSSSPIVFGDANATPVARRAPVAATSAKPKSVSPIIPQPQLAPSVSATQPQSHSAGNGPQQQSTSSKGKGKAVDQDEEPGAQCQPVVNSAGQNGIAARPTLSSSTKSGFRPAAHPTPSAAPDNDVEIPYPPISRDGSQSPFPLSPHLGPPRTATTSSSSAPSHPLPAKPNAQLPTPSHPLPPKPIASTSTSIAAVPPKPPASISNPNLPPRPVSPTSPNPNPNPSPLPEKPSASTSQASPAPSIKASTSPHKPPVAQLAVPPSQRPPQPSEPSGIIYLSSSSEAGESDQEGSDSDLEIVSSTPAVRPRTTETAQERELRELDLERKLLEKKRDRLREKEREKKEEEEREERELQARIEEGKLEELRRIEEKESERKRLEAEKIEKDRLEAEAAKEELERLEDEAEKLECERVARERIEQHERWEKERLEKERLEKEKLEKEKLEKEKLERESVEREKLAKENLEKEELEKERSIREALVKDRLERERLEKEILEKERLENEVRAKEEMERMKEVRKENQRIERERIQAERIEAKRIESERIAAERVEKERRDAEREERKLKRVIKETEEFRDELPEEVQDRWDSIFDNMVIGGGYEDARAYEDLVEIAQIALKEYFDEEEWTQEGYDEARARSEAEMEEGEDEESDTEMEIVETVEQAEQGKEDEDKGPSRALNIFSGGVLESIADILAPQAKAVEPVHPTPPPAPAQAQHAATATATAPLVPSRVRGFADDDEESDQEPNVLAAPRPTGFAPSDDGEEEEPSKQANQVRVANSDLRNGDTIIIDESEPETPINPVNIDSGIHHHAHTVAQVQSPIPQISDARPHSNPEQPLTSKKTKSAHSFKRARKSTGGARPQPVVNPRTAFKSTAGGRPRALPFAPSNLSPLSRQSSPDPLSLAIDDCAPFEGVPQKREARGDRRDSQGRWKRPRKRNSDRSDDNDSPESGTTTPTSQGGLGTKLALESRKEDGSAQQIVAPLPLGDAVTTSVESALDMKEREQSFKLEQQLLPPHQRQIGGPTYDLNDEFSRAIQEHVQYNCEQAWKKKHPHGESPLRDGYKGLYEHIIYKANSKEFPRGLQPSIRICPLKSAKPFDWSSPPFEICYTNRVVYVDGIVPKQAPGCGCVGNCGDPRNRGGCACRKRQIMASKQRAGGAERSEHQDFAYDANGIVDPKVFAMNDPIIECNSQCGCGPECINRVVGNRKAISVDIFHTGSKGWAVRNPTSYTNDPLNGNYRQRVIKRGEPLGVYAGELATTETIEEREALVYSRTKRCYTYSLDIWTIGEDYKALAPKADADKMIISSIDAPHRPPQLATKSARLGKSKGKKKAKAKSSVEAPAKIGEIDGTKAEDDTFRSIYSVDAFSFGNWTRFANHVCQGFNVVPRAVYVDDSDITRPLWVYVARKDIQPGEEITISYFSENDPDPKEVGLSARAWRECANKLREEQPKLFRCYCESKFCRGVMFAINDPNCEIFYNKHVF